MFFRFLFSLFFIVIFLNSCASNKQVLKVQQNNNTYKLSFTHKGKTKTFVLNNFKKTNSFDTCVASNSYTIFERNKHLGNIYLEAISLKSNCQWNGLASGYFIYEFKQKFESFEKVFKQEKQNLILTTYKVDGEKYIDMVELYYPNRNVFILDSKGIMTKSLLELFQFESYEKRFLESRLTLKDYNNSLVRQNIFKNFFSREENDELLWYLN